MMVRQLLLGLLAGSLLAACGRSGEKAPGEKHPTALDLMVAKINLVGIARGAEANYRDQRFSREGVQVRRSCLWGERFCPSAPPTPSAIPIGGATGWPVNTTEWDCLGFWLIGPTRYQYSYEVGRDYKGPKRGGKDPGLEGFEACAEADFEPGGETTLICTTGTVDPKSGRPEVDDDFFVAAE